MTRYGHNHDVPSAVSAYTGYPEAYRFVAFNALCWCDAPARNAQSERTLVLGNLSAISSMAMTYANGMMSYSCVDQSDIAHSSTLMNGVAALGLFPLARSSLGPEASCPFLDLIDADWQWIYAPAQSSINQAAIDGYGHRYGLDVLGRAFEEYTHPSESNAAALAASISTLQGRVLPAGWQIAEMPTGTAGVIVAPDGMPPTGYTSLLPAQGMVLEKSGATEVFDESYQFVGLSFEALACLMAQDAGDNATANALSAIIDAQKPPLLARISSAGVVNAADSGRIGHETDQGSGAIKTMDIRNAILAAQYAGYATGDADWWTARNELATANP